MIEDTCNGKSSILGIFPVLSCAYSSFPET